MEKLNVMRHEYKELSIEDKAAMARVKDYGLDFYTFCNLLGGDTSSRELSIAKTKIEEAVMWATKHITR